MDNNVKELGNGFYSGSLIALGVVGMRYATKQMGFKDRPVEMKLKSLMMLGLEIGAATALVQKLQASGTIPSKVFT